MECSQHNDVKHRVKVAREKGERKKENKKIKKKEEERGSVWNVLECGGSDREKRGKKKKRKKKGRVREGYLQTSIVK